MPITFRCNCGKKLQVTDDMAGKQVRCADCQSVVTVPGGQTPMAARLTEAPARRARPVADEPAPARRPRSSRKSGSGSNGLLIALILGGLAVVVIGCLGIGGVAAYFLISGKSSAESTLVGDWELDPDNTPIILIPLRISFGSDHTYHMQAGWDFDGTWQVTNRSGNTLTLSMTTNFMGMKSDTVSHPTVTVIDKDHIRFDANGPGMQASNSTFRRVGSGGSPLKPGGAVPGLGGGGGNQGPKTDPNAPGLGDRGKMNPEIDKGMVADCEIEWGRQWYEGKILKTEKDRWFVHYIGWGSNFDEWVGKDRIRFKKK